MNAAMLIDIDSIRRGRKLIARDQRGLFLDGHYASLRARVYSTPHLKNDNHQSTILIYNQMSRLDWELQDFLVTLPKMEWLHRCYVNELLNADEWLLFGAAEANAFHIVFRSLFDQFLKLILVVTDLEGRTIQNSFTTLRKKAVEDPEAISAIGKDLLDRLREISWFDDINSARNDVVHNGAITIAYPSNDKILFSIHSGLVAISSIPEVMYNENVLDYRRYTAMVCGYTIDFLDRLSESLGLMLVLLEPNSQVASIMRSSPAGLSVAATWIDDLLEHTKKQSP